MIRLEELRKGYGLGKEKHESKAIENLPAAQKRAMAIRPKVGGFPHLAAFLIEDSSPAKQCDSALRQPSMIGDFLVVQMTNARDKRTVNILTKCAVRNIVWSPGSPARQHTHAEIRQAQHPTRPD